MKNEGYYNYPIDDTRDETVPLRVNCTGYASLDQPFVTHNSRKDWYLQLIDTGALRRQESGEADFVSGQFVIRPPDTPYYYELPPSGEIGYYWMHFTGSSVEELLERCHLVPGQIAAVSEDAMHTLRRQFSTLFRECMLRAPCYTTMAASMAAEILVRLGRATLSPAEYDSDARARLEAASAYIHRHYTEPVCIKDLSALCHLSESRFRDLFRLAYRRSPREYLQELRLGHACELLSTTDYTITEIARLCGYPDVLYFIRLFRNKIGTPPGTFRKNTISQSARKSEPN